jgi:transposase InsO family protein
LKKNSLVKYTDRASELFQMVLPRMVASQAGNRDSFSHELLHAFRSVGFHEADWEPQLDIMRNAAMLIENGTLPGTSLTRSLRMGTRRLYQWFEEAGVQVTISIGGPPVPDRNLIAERVRELREGPGIRCGYRHTAESIALPGQRPHYHAVYQILHRLGRQPDRPRRVHTHMFVAKYIAYMWHTDLHEIQVRDEATGGTSRIYVIAFLDDASRFVMHYRLIYDKRSDPCAAFLAEACQMWAAPCVLGSDNGGKFTGAACARILQEYGVSHWRKTPIPRNKTGKMERFSGSLESVRKGGFSEKLR